MFTAALTPSTYRKNPTRAAATSWWKVAHNALPAGVRIVHSSEDRGGPIKPLRYFKMIHHFDQLQKPTLPKGYQFVDVFDETHAPEIAAMINECYPEIHVEADDVSSWLRYPVAAKDLWVGVTDPNGTLVATGIAERDASVSEVSMDWVQVLRAARGHKLGQAIVRELLRRAKGTAEYATVSGRIRTTSAPDALYRSCGFTDEEIWHIYMPADK